MPLPTLNSEANSMENYGLQPRSIAFAMGLAILSAVIVGVVPGLKSTGRRLNADLRRLGSGASMRLGRVWTILIVTQVAVAVTVLPTAVYLGLDNVRRAAVRATFPADEFLTATVGVAVPIQPGMDGADHRRETTARLAVRVPELEQRLEAEPAVAGVTFGQRSDLDLPIEVEGIEGLLDRRSAVSMSIASDYFEVFGARILAGRPFGASDADEPGGGFIVNEAFVRTVLDGDNAIGRRVRVLPESEAGADAEQGDPGPWHEIVGVVEDLQASYFDREWAPPVVYSAVRPGQVPIAELLVRVRAGEADDFAPRLRQITATLDPNLRLVSVTNLATLRNPRLLATIATVLVLALSTVLLLSAAGIHALMSLAVTRRRREIGIRTALGAHPFRLLASIFSRAAWQLSLGGLVGSLLGAALLFKVGLTGRQAAVLLVGVAVLMLTVGLLAAAGPARRGLRIQPMEALREE
ncbi:MAG: FtsX-like permease family protein [Gemmatimonas sp.]|nr:FtsX-like permease family protein [Gemmatimonas sp.]